jgi:hypothetical protein
MTSVLATAREAMNLLTKLLSDVKEQQDMPLNVAHELMACLHYMRGQVNGIEDQLDI